jgi:hypothetical protein
MRQAGDASHVIAQQSPAIGRVLYADVVRTLILGMSRDGTPQRRDPQNGKMAVHTTYLGLASVSRQRPSSVAEGNS